MKYLRGIRTVVGASVVILAAVGATVAACGGTEPTGGTTSTGTDGTGGVGTTTSGFGGGATGTGGAASTGTGGTGGMPLAGYDCAPPAGSVPALKLTEVASGIKRPVLVKGEPGDNSRLFVLGQDGKIWIIKDGAMLPTPFLDISAVVHQPSAGDERGLLGIAFHPKYAQNGRFFLFYSTDVKMGAPAAQHLVEFKRSADPNVAVPEPVQTLFTEKDGEANHNGGMIEFSPKDGYLYVGMGDGGGAGDQHGNFGYGQDLSSRWGKILRLDVDSATKPYGIPAGNMTKVPPADPNDPGKLGNPSNPATLNGEIWDYGLRNPWRFSFDACTADLYIGDVGQDKYEEIDIEPAGKGNVNYGWRLTEGMHDFKPENYSTMNVTYPKFEYAHKKAAEVPGTQGRCSVAGGYVYRGSAIPGLRGTYFFGDFCSNEIWTLSPGAIPKSDYQESAASSLRVPGDLLLASFGQDNLGEIYAIAIDGHIYRIDAK